ncbi:MAG TPA: hypothetical protein DIT34_05505 [Acinetobacter ursingii]|uniref:HTH iclR-type domain-containing protein n=1 Tax=Acinetobacter ursingii TaxID=108980 RepID=A0A3D2SPP8_9GAMM|nr:helix-turn-helix domain-containing protein [Acinetobacter ursingii]MCU4589120.1 helix-turn-helix domain-containing protein [Acinetobacter ursingii]HCK30110.1 hypothetical protein [Acinetobacter ursingii]HCO07763.1 hypothetical protein [Acinetobacter ursingii]
MSNYVEIFDNIVFVLSQFAETDKALNSAEVEHKLGVSKRTAQRICKSLSESGWLYFKRVGHDKLYFASEKTKRLFGDKP